MHGRLHLSGRVYSQEKAAQATQRVAGQLLTEKSMVTVETRLSLQGSRRGHVYT